MLHGKARTMGLGPFHTVSLAEAREAAREARQLRLQGIDPLDERKARLAAKRLEAVESTTFKEAAEAYIAAHESGWRNAKHAKQWSSTLSTYAYPKLGDLSVQAIDTGLVLKVLEPIWNEKTETAGRLRGRIEAVLDWATARGYRRGDNPARWQGHVDKLLPPRTKVRKVRHHPALPYTEIGEFINCLRAENGIAALALEFTILTACRTSEIVGSMWNEVDLKQRVWTIPGARMKAEKEHRAPLSNAALAILNAVPRLEGNDFVFPGIRPGRPLSNMALLQLLKRMSHKDLTVHGFRSTFRDWAAERTAYPRDVAEMALAHSIGDKVEAAYRRGDLFDKRRSLMNDWAKFCGTEIGASSKR